MMKTCLLLYLLVVPFILPAQTNRQYLSLYNKEIYKLVNILIRKEKLDRRSRLDTIPAPDCSLNGSDKKYLQTLLIKPPKIDTTQGNDPVTLFSGYNVNFPDKNIFTQQDIQYILSVKKKFRHFKWDSKGLGFTSTHTKEYYSVSVPCFNLKHDKAILMYEYLCPGLCGTGKTLLLEKHGNSWDVSTLEMWWH